MEKEINVAEILKDKPKGTKLYSSACGKCQLEEVDDKSFKISFYSSKFGFMNGGEGYLDKNGKLYDDGECVVFPSKEMRDWSKFAWKKGDVLVLNEGIGKLHVIFEGFDDDTYTTFKGKHYLCNYGDNEEDYNDYNKEVNLRTILFKKDDMNDAQTYINTIEEKLGGKLNRETLEIEKQPEFKDGDILYAEKDESHTDAIFILETVKGKIGHYACLILHPYMVCKYSCGGIGNKILRYATEEEKLQLFDALAKEGKVWDSKKKQIVDLKPKLMTLKPFDKVITRVDVNAIWTANIFSHIDQYGEYNTIGCVGGYPYCLPYNEETAKLIGTTDDWKG